MFRCLFFVSTFYVIHAMKKIKTLVRTNEIEKIGKYWFTFYIHRLNSFLGSVYLEYRKKKT